MLKPPRKSINKINKVLLHEDTLLDVAIYKEDITVKLESCKDRFFNYILVENDVIQYIGYTSNLYLRMFSHKYSQMFDTILLLEFKDERTARDNERYMIKQLKPNSNYQFC